MNDKFMKRAIELSVENVNKGGGPFASVIVKDNKIIAEGSNKVTLSNDPTAHGEIVAIRESMLDWSTYAEATYLEARKAAKMKTI